MITVKCFYANSDTITTDINATFEEAETYFVGKVFNIGTGADGEAEDNLQQCVRIEEIK